MAVEDGDGVFSRSISQLVSLLRTSFRSKEFDEVEEILVAREVEFKKELKKKEKENEFLGSKLKVMRLEKASVEAELEELREKAEELLNVINTDRSEAQERKKRAVKRYGKLWEEAQKKREPELNQKRTILEPTNQYSELERWKKQVKGELARWEKSFEESGTQKKKLSNIGEAKGGAKVIDFDEQKLMAVAGNEPVSPRIVVQIMDSDDEWPGKAFCVKRNSSGNLENNHRRNVGIHKRKRDSSDKSTPNESEADDENDVILVGNPTRKPQEIVANTDNTFGKANHDWNVVKTAGNLSTNDSNHSSDYDDDIDSLSISHILSLQQWGRKALRNGHSYSSRENL